MSMLGIGTDEVEGMTAWTTSGRHSETGLRNIANFYTLLMVSMDNTKAELSEIHLPSRAKSSHLFVADMPSLNFPTGEKTITRTILDGIIDNSRYKIKRFS